jgi:acyl-CoA oxidase
VNDLQKVLDGRWAAVRDDVRAQLGEVRLDPDLPTDSYRAQVTAALRELAATRRPHRGFDPAYGGSGDVAGVVTAFQMLGYGDLSLLVKAGVQWGCSAARCRTWAPRATTTATCATRWTARCWAASR